MLCKPGQLTLDEKDSLRFHLFFFFQAEDGIRDGRVTGVQTCALPIYLPCWQRDAPLALLASLCQLGKWIVALLGDLHQAGVERAHHAERLALDVAAILRSEERRVGKECRSRLWPAALKEYE